MFKNLSRREKILIVLAFVIALSAVYYFYFYQPLKAEIAVIKNERENKQNRLDIAMSFARRLPEIKEEYKNILTEIEKRGDYIDKDVINLLIDFREISKANNLDLTLFRPTENTNNISMTVNIEGGFREITNLLSDFKEWNYWFEFRDVNISRSEN